MPASERVVALCVVVALLGSAAPALAQTGEQGERPENVHVGEAIPIGPFLFSPLLELTWESRDNIFFSPDNIVADYVYVADAKLMLELPIYDSYVRFSYMPRYRDYKDYDFGLNWTHFVDLAGEFSFSSGLKLTTEYRYITGNLENREVDPGGELVPGEQQYDKQYVRVAADYWLTSRDGISLLGSFSDVKIKERFLPYTSLSYGIGWLHQLNDTVVTDLRWRRGKFDSDSTDAFRDSTYDELTLGVRGQLTATVATELRVGWRATDYDQRQLSATFQDFSGFVVNGAFSVETAHGGVLRLDLLRTDYSSSYANNGYYTATGGSILYNLKRGRFFGQARVRLQNNDYEVEDPVLHERRSDDIKTFGLGLGWRVASLLSLRGSYLYEERDTLHPYSYETNIFVLGLTLGF